MSIVIVGGGLWWLNSWLTVQKQAQDSANKVPVPVARSAPSPQVPIVKTVHQIQIIQPTHTRDKVGAQSSPSKVTAKDNGIAVGGISQGAGSALSFNQTGGITAGTVNFAPQDRHLSDEQRATIKTIVNGRVCKITMMGYLQNVEDAQSFALEIRDAFKLAGCTVPDGVVPLMNPNGPWVGVKVVYHDESIHVEGERVYTSPDTPQGIILAALDGARLGQVMVGGDAVTPLDTIEVAVGRR